MIHFPTRTESAFTLIELLIVVAIIGILAAIAIPNFLEAQARGKIARVQSDMRTTATALEIYYVDHDAYPPCALPGMTGLIMPARLRLVPLTSPIQYIGDVPCDPFREFSPIEMMREAYCYREEKGYRAVIGPWPLAPVVRWELRSFGPDCDCDMAGIVTPYDTTNGTVSNGDVIRWGP